MKYATAGAAAAALCSVANAHMFISSPVPIAGSNSKSPLNADGSNFPCQGAALPGSGGQPMAVGSSQQLVFNTGGGYNTAVHGGGSCQLSVTYETEASKIADPSNWYVIYSIEEGCPSNTPLNLDGSYTGPSGTYQGSNLCNDTITNGFDCVNSFNFTLPPQVKNGQATLAWTWFNTVGNREMYMNCAAIDITGGQSDSTKLETLPNMFVANLAVTGVASTCVSTEGINLAFPDPGQYLFTKTPTSRMYVASATSQYPIGTPTGCGSIVSASSAAATTASSLATSATTSKASSVKTSNKTTAASGKASTTKSTSSAKKTSSSTKKTTTVKATVTGNAAVKTSSSRSAAASATSTCVAGSVPCTTFNSVICVDSSHFGICDYNGCAISQAVAAGTMCQNGMITWATSNKKRGAAHRHSARKAHGDSLI